jgi:hypothetical protein
LTYFSLKTPITSLKSRNLRQKRTRLSNTTNGTTPTTEITTLASIPAASYIISQQRPNAHHSAVRKKAAPMGMPAIPTQLQLQTRK